MSRRYLVLLPIALLLLAAFLLQLRTGQPAPATVGVSSSVHQEEGPQKTRNATTPEPQKAAVPGSGNAHEAREHLRYVMQRNPALVTRVENPDGSEVVFLNGTYSTVAAARRLPDGSLEVSCFERFEALESFLADSDAGSGSGN